MTARMSILHRFTGLLLTMGLLIVAAWLIAAMMGPDYYAQVMALAQTTAGKAVLYGWSFVLYYHLFNGIRHLFWDMGYLFELRNARIAGWVVIFSALLMTLGTWYFAPSIAAGTFVETFTAAVKGLFS